MEKVINDFKVIETEDGFRIELKGNKEAMRRMLSRFDFSDSIKAGAPYASSHPCSDYWSEFSNGCGYWAKRKEYSRRA
jgi:hypothetical protein